MSSDPNNIKPEIRKANIRAMTVNFLMFFYLKMSFLSFIYKELFVFINI